MGYILDTHEQVLKEIDLYRAIRNIQYGIPQSPYHLFSLLAMLNSKTNMFFTPVGKPEVALHELFEMSTLSMEEILYGRYIPMSKELNMLKTKDIRIYKIY